jgi:outer membrane murein-binding lipoprotein Lpp
MAKFRHQSRCFVLGMLLLTGCASHADDAKLQADMVILTQKMQALNTELIELKARQAKQQKLNAELQRAKLQQKKTEVKQDTAE